MTATRHLVFLSHSSRDTWVARQLADQVKAAGADVFLDASDLRAGDPFAESIRTALNQADELLVLWTPWATERLNIAVEIGAAWARGIRIVQVLYGVTAPGLSRRTNFPGFLNQLQMLPLEQFQTYVIELQARIVEKGTQR